MGRRNSEYHEAQQPAPQIKPIAGLIDSFCDTYKPVRYEDEADEVFTIGRIREYFSAWPIPKMPDPLGAYIDELSTKGFPMQTTYDGSPAIFVVRWKTNGEVCGAVEEVAEKEERMRTGLTQVSALLEQRMRRNETEEDPFTDEDETEDEDSFTDEEDSSTDEEDSPTNEDEGSFTDEDETEDAFRYGTKEPINQGALPY